jgi:hypothetical protein
MFEVILHHALRGFLFSYNTIINGRNPQETKFSLLKFFYNPKNENYYKLPDLTFMDIWAMQLRGFGPVSWFFWPLLVVLDIHLLIGAIYDKYFDNQEEDVINFLGKIFVSREYVPTPTSWLALKFLNQDNLIYRLCRYWAGWRKNPGFVQLYVKKMDKVGIK